MAGLSFIKVVGRFGLVVADTQADSGQEPDTIWCDSGEVWFTPLISYTKAATAQPVPALLGQSVIKVPIDSDGYLSLNGTRSVYLTDLTSRELNPYVPDGKATHRVEFRNLRADGQDLTVPSFTTRFAPDVLGSGLAIDLTMAAPVATANGTSVIVGPAGDSVIALELVAGRLMYTLAGGEKTYAGDIPTGAGGSDVGVASYLSTDGSESRKAALNVVEASPYVSGAKLQSILLGRAMQKFRKGLDVSIVCRGDSITYGHDLYSSDKISAPAGNLPDGSYHTATRSPSPWPLILGQRLDAVYAGSVTTKNQGYSGDWTGRGFDRWTENAHADITVISYGQNDASANYIPAQFTGNVAEFVMGHERMILRDLAWGSAVVLVSTIKNRGSQGGLDTDIFRNALQALANKYGIPLIDGGLLLENASPDSWSDEVHLSTKGNNTVGSRLAAAFIGDGPQNPHFVRNGSKLLPRLSSDNFVVTGQNSFPQSPGHETPAEDSPTAGTAAYSQNDGVSYWSFYTDEPDVVLFPYVYMSTSGSETGARWKMTLDFDVSQGDTYTEAIIDNDGGTDTGIAPSSVESQMHAGGQSSYQNDVFVGNTWLRIATPGWHSIRFTSTSSANATKAIQAVELLSWRLFQKMRGSVTTTPPVSSGGAKGVILKSIPATYTSNAPNVNETRFKASEVLAALGLENWSGDYYKAVMLRLTVSTFNIGTVRYRFYWSGQGGANIAAVPVGTANALNPQSISVVNQSQVIPHGAADPLSSSQSRELASVSYVTATDELVFTWRTTSSVGGAAKVMNVFSQVFITID